MPTYVDAEGNELVDAAGLAYPDGPACAVPPCCGPAPLWYRFKVCGCQTGGGGANLASYYVFWEDVVAYYLVRGRPIPECPVGKPDGKCASIDTANPGVGNPTGTRYTPGGSFPLLDSCCECCAFANLPQHCCWSQVRTFPGGPLITGVLPANPSTPPPFQRVTTHNFGQFCCFSRKSGSYTMTGQRELRVVPAGGGPLSDWFVAETFSMTATLANGIVTVSATSQVRNRPDAPFNVDTASGMTSATPLDCTPSISPATALARYAAQINTQVSGPFGHFATLGAGQGPAGSTSSVGFNLSCHAYTMDEVFEIMGTGQYATTPVNRGFTTRQATLAPQADCEGCEGGDPGDGGGDTPGGDCGCQHAEGGDINAAIDGMMRGQFGRPCMGCG